MNRELRPLPPRTAPGFESFYYDLDGGGFGLVLTSNCLIDSLYSLGSYLNANDWNLVSLQSVCCIRSILFIL